MNDATAGSQASARGGSPGLRARILSAAVMLPAGIAVIWAGGWFLGAAAAVCAMLMAFEWARMSEPAKPLAGAAVMAASSAVCVLAAAAGRYDWMAPALVLGGLAAAARRRTLQHAFESFSGTIYVGAPCAALVWIRAAPDSGMSYALALLCIICATDVAAYAVGKAVGGPKLLPETSPRKTWSGFVGGAVAAVLAGLGCAAALGAGPAAWVGAALAVSCIGQLGDMLESIIKRHFAVKDASRLIPGHGGVMDRLDALMAAVLFAAIVLATAPAFAPGLGPTPR